MLYGGFGRTRASLLFLVLAVAPLRADEIAVAPETGDSLGDYQLDKVTTTTTRWDRLMQTAQSLSIIRSEEWEGTGKSLADVIAEQTGVQTRRFGGTGSFQSVSVRGVQGSEVLVLLDGFPLNSAMGGAVDLSSVNPERIGSVEIYKGITPSRFGGNSIGGIIHLRSKQQAVGNVSDVSFLAGAYGYQSYSAAVGQDISNAVRLNASLSFIRSNNDWPYRDRNNTPYNDLDDTVRTVANHRYNGLHAKVQPSFQLGGKRKICTAVGMTASSQGIPAVEGKVNKTARYDREMIDVLARFENTSPYATSAFQWVPEIGFLRLHEYNFWTSLDQSVGTSHGGFSSSSDSWGETDFVMRSLYAACHFQSQFARLAGLDATLHARHSDAVSKTRVIGFPHGDWPGETQEAGVATDFRCGIPMGAFSLGGTVGGSIKGIRSQTTGGENEVFGKTVPAADTVEPAWSARSGVRLHFRNTGTLFFNMGRYSDLPSLREKYGTRGAVAPNPYLTEETGKQMEAGIRVMLFESYLEAAFFRVLRENSIMPLSDGNMTIPVNLGGAFIYGIEWTLSCNPVDWLNPELRGTWQRTENQSRANNWYGNELPNEPDLSLLAKAGLGPFFGFRWRYWVDFKSSFYRDHGNTAGQRVPEDEEASGLLFHNAMVEWDAGARFSSKISIRNISGNPMRYEETVTSNEGGYSWILYPQNEWCFSLSCFF